MQIELAGATLGDRPVLENLLNLYAHDFSEILGNAPGPDGRYVYEHLDSFLQDADRFPFFIRTDGLLAGFALVSRGSAISGDPQVWDMTEFFVVRGLRRRGLGGAAASAAFRRFPGAWEVRVMDRNPGAVPFWTRAVSLHTDGRFDAHPWRSETGEAWNVFRFSQPPA